MLGILQFLFIQCSELNIFDVQFQFSVFGGIVHHLFCCLVFINITV